MNQNQAGVLALIGFAVYAADLVLGAFADASFLPLLGQVISLFICCFFFVLMVSLAERNLVHEQRAET